MFLFFDTETTGLTNSQLPATDESQPWPVAVAAILCDGDLNEVEEYYRVVKLPAGVVIHPKAQEVHGLSWEKTQEIGEDPAVVLSAFIALMARSNFNVAYNRPFDDKVMRAMAYRTLLREGLTPKRISQIALDMRFTDIDDFLAHYVFGKTEGHCAMDLATNFIKMPGRGMVDNGGWRRHKLTAAYKLLTGLPMPDAHNALADTRGAKEVFKAMLTATV